MTLCICRYKAFQYKKEKEKSKPKGSRRKEIKIICLMQLMKERINKIQKWFFEKCTKKDMYSNCDLKKT